MNKTIAILGMVGCSTLVVSCTDNDAPPADGSVYDFAGDVNWPVDESGVVVVNDGAVIVEDDGGAWVCYPVSCGDHDTLCGNCLDDDGDGLVDSHDPQCLGPCDNTEGPGLESGVGGTGGDTCKVDCYFDWGNGQGNDECIWDHHCDPLEPEKALGCTYDEGYVGHPQKCPDEMSSKCPEFCLPYTPNGCDCFGCCTFPELAGKGEDGADIYVWIGAMDDKNNSTCTLDAVSDPAKCPPCTPLANCLNECGRCEICIGKPTVPEDCFDPPAADGGAAPDGPATNPGQCPEGQAPCGLPGQQPCMPGSYCISGCCVEVSID